MDGSLKSQRTFDLSAPAAFKICELFKRDYEDMGESDYESSNWESSGERYEISFPLKYTAVTGGDPDSISVWELKAVTVRIIKVSDKVTISVQVTKTFRDRKLAAQEDPAAQKLIRAVDDEKELLHVLEERMEKGSKGSQ